MTFILFINTHTLGMVWWRLESKSNPIPSRKPPMNMEKCSTHVCPKMCVCLTWLPMGSTTHWLDLDQDTMNAERLFTRFWTRTRNASSRRALLMEYTSRLSWRRLPITPSTFSLTFTIAPDPLVWVKSSLSETCARWPTTFVPATTLLKSLTLTCDMKCWIVQSGAWIWVTSTVCCGMDTKSLMIASFMLPKRSRESKLAGV